MKEAQLRPLRGHQNAEMPYRPQVNQTYNRRNIQKEVRNMLLRDIIFYFLLATTTASIALYFTLLVRLKASSEVKLSEYLGKTKHRKPAKKKQRPPKSAEPPAAAMESVEPIYEMKERECPHYVGYLTTLSKGSSFPEECFGCRKVIRCMRIEPSEAIESFYLAASEAEKGSQ